MPANDAVRHMWLELTNRCNLRCGHCYSSSSPEVEEPDPLQCDRYKAVLAEARGAGCSSVQFIGGEPTLNRDLPALIREASRLCYKDIEVFTNLVSLPGATLATMVEHGVSVATSFYGGTAAPHDAVTQQPGSWAKTLRNIRTVTDHNLSLRVGFIDTAKNRGEYDAVVALLAEFGVTDIGYDEERPFGRATQDETTTPDVTRLCGNCASGSICVLPNGDVSLCIMSRSSVVGNVRDQPLSVLVEGGDLGRARSELRQAWGEALTSCGPACSPNCVPSCNPRCSPNCSPCYPYGKCNPDLFRGSDAAVLN